MLLAVSLAVLSVAKACEQPTVSLALYQKGSQHWSGADYVQPGSCRTLTITFPSNSTLILSAQGKARAANVDTFTIADSLDTLLESSDAITGSWRVPNGLAVDWQNAVTVQLNTAGDQTPPGDITISYEVVEMLPQFKPTGQLYPLQFPVYQASIVEPLSLMPDHNVTLAFSAVNTTEQLDFAVVSEVALTGAQRESLVNVFVMDGKRDAQRPRCRLLSALVTPNACRSGNAAYILTLDDTHSPLLTAMTVIVTRKSFSNTPIQYHPIFLNKGNTDTSITWTGKGSAIIPLILKYYSEPSDGMFVKSVDYQGAGDLHVFTGGASYPNTVLSLFHTAHNESALWRDFVLETPWAYSLGVPQDATVKLLLGNARYHTEVVEHAAPSNGVLMSSRHPLRTSDDVSFNRTMRTGGKLSKYLFEASTAFDVGSGTIDFRFVRKDTNENVVDSYSGLRSPNGLWDTATEFTFSYKHDADDVHIGFLLRYYITPAKLARPASLLAALAATLLAVY